MSKTTIKFGKIEEAPFGFGFRRSIKIIETDKVSPMQITIDENIHADIREELEIIDCERGD